MTTGIVFDIKDFTIHDGPGIRTTALQTIRSLAGERSVVFSARESNLIARVWGWRGYFCELVPEYQDHIIARHLYQTD